jgi:predicted HicB family RNase H-like nuclease
MASRRAFADEYAVRVNRAVELLTDCSAADAVRALQLEHELSERQARRYVNAAIERPGGLSVPERTVVFTVRMAPSLIARLRVVARSRGVSLSATVAEAIERYLGHVERHGGSAS